ncbi:GntR family transcriptional regulator [Xylophilus ampelinus]|uniref:DNA-binding GntR family transcriptional regulator n=1 Tax=Xylophilus ampelinus TaxID=54067 RepID=A0A318SLI9_9BURK|nr:GntR family transcriptional regulator [Xylophilus ampelinus]MCS4509087.1 GntR family transcriptional regulator [Xylophilus ampelinus]PYE79886.1 DNA-binding GntR family transcriptional regulator [Xylophilus ampelinus]
MAASSADISTRIIEAVMARKLAPGTRLGEQQLAILFNCSRTIVREALTRLATRGIVTVVARRGWFVVESSEDEAREAFAARRVIELGLIRQMPPPGKPALKQLQLHLQREKAALRGSDVGARSFLLGDFHVCLAECLGNHLLADTLRDFTARTSLIAMRYQSSQDAARSCEDHVRIVAALEAGDTALAERLMSDHIATVQNALRSRPTAEVDTLRQLGDALAPMACCARGTHRSSAVPTASGPSASLDSSTYLGASL